MRIPALLLACLVLSAGNTDAQVRQFPYDAVVRADNLYVRSGPGQRYYATGKLNTGDRVTVHRHDPGGWYMIAPPAGSFSWIDASLVQKTSDRQGVVRVPPVEGGIQARAVVRIGSQLSSDASVYSRELADGDLVTIIGQQQVTIERGSVLMYKIAPPALEYRWVKGDYIVPASADLQRAHDLDPFATPTNAAESLEPDPAAIDLGDGQGDVRQRDLLRTTASSTPDGQLEFIDREYQAMMAGDPADWRFEDFEREYRRLAAANPELAGAIDHRLERISARKNAHGEYLEFLRLTRATTQRDAQLASMQSSGPPPIQPVRLGTPETAPAMSPAPGQPRLSLEPIPDEELAAETTDRVAPKLDGAGIVTRTANPLGGIPRHALVAPDGRFLAFLEPAPGVNVNLDALVGREMGVIGQRTRDPLLQTDRIVVRRAMPVKLRP